MSEPIWAVSSGSYSDYRVHAVFTTKKLAEAAATLQGREYGGGYDVEQFMLFDQQPAMVTTYTLWQELTHDGHAAEPRIDIRTEPEFDMLWPRPGRRARVDFICAPMHHGNGGRLEVRAETETAMRKAHSDAFAEWQTLTPPQRKHWKVKR